MADQRVNGSLVLIGSNGGTVALGSQANGGGFTYLLPTAIPQVGQFLMINSVFNGNTATAQWVSLSTPAYQTVQQAGISKPAEPRLNFLSPITVTDNPSNSSTDIAVPTFIGSGVTHAIGLVPDPGSTAGTTRFLREDSTWAVPADSDAFIGGTIAVNQVAFGTASNTIGGSANFTWNNATQVLNVNGPNSSLLNIDTAGDIDLIGGLISTAVSIHAGTNVGVGGHLYTLSMDPGSTGTGGLQIAHNLGSGSAFVWDAATGYMYLRSSTGLAGIGVASAAGTPAVMLLPTTTGTAGQVLSTNGANPQQLSWITAGGGVSGSIATNQIAFGTATNTIGGSSNLTWVNSTGALAVDSTGGGGVVFTVSGGASSFNMTNSGSGGTTIADTGNGGVTIQSSSGSNPVTLLMSPHGGFLSSSSASILLPSSETGFQVSSSAPVPVSGYESLVLISAPNDLGTVGASIELAGQAGATGNALLTMNSATGVNLSTATPGASITVASSGGVNITNSQNAIQLQNTGGGGTFIVDSGAGGFVFHTSGGGGVLFENLNTGASSFQISNAGTNGTQVTDSGGGGVSISTSSGSNYINLENTATGGTLIGDSGGTGIELNVNGAAAVYAITSVDTSVGPNATYHGTFPIIDLIDTFITIAGFTTSANNFAGHAVSSTRTTLVMPNPSAVAETHAATGTDLGGALTLTNTSTGGTYIIDSENSGSGINIEASGTGNLISLTNTGSGGTFVQDTGGGGLTLEADSIHGGTQVTASLTAFNFDAGVSSAVFCNSFNPGGNITLTLGDFLDGGTSLVDDSPAGGIFFQSLGAAGYVQIDNNVGTGGILITNTTTPGVISSGITVTNNGQNGTSITDAGGGGITVLNSDTTGGGPIQIVDKGTTGIIIETQNAASNLTLQSGGVGMTLEGAGGFIQVHSDSQISINTGAGFTTAGIQVTNDGSGGIALLQEVTGGPISLTNTSSTGTISATNHGSGGTFLTDTGALGVDIAATGAVSGYGVQISDSSVNSLGIQIRTTSANTSNSSTGILIESDATGTNAGISLNNTAGGGGTAISDSSGTGITISDTAAGGLFLYTTGNLAFFSGSGSAKPTVTGSRGGNAALASLLTALAALGLITNSTTP